MNMVPAMECNGATSCWWPYTSMSAQLWVNQIKTSFSGKLVPTIQNICRDTRRPVHIVSTWQASINNLLPHVRSSTSSLMALPAGGRTSISVR
jgi:hypothetical protein